MKREERQQLIDEQQKIVFRMDTYLKDSDYTGIKRGEGVAEEAEYQDIKEKRQQWREEKNAAVAEIERLKAIEPEDDDDTPEVEE